VGAVPDLVHAGRNGDVFAAGDVPALATILRTMIADQSLRVRMGQNSREMISGWNYDKCVVGVKAALESLSRKAKHKCA